MSNRRRFLLGSLGVVGVLGLGAWGLGPLAAEAQIAAVLRRRLSFLHLDEAGVHAFAKDHVASLFHRKMPTLNRLKYHFQSAVAPSFQRFYRSNDHRSRVEKMEDSLVSTYLLSSDFFQNGGDEARMVQYVALYDPLRACGDPFRRPVMDETAQKVESA